jgi:hypothetical protein
LGEERASVGFDDQWIAISSMADHDPILTVDKNGQRHFYQMVWVNKRPDDKRYRADYACIKTVVSHVQNLADEQAQLAMLARRSH